MTNNSEIGPIYGALKIVQGTERSRLFDNLRETLDAPTIETWDDLLAIFARYALAAIAPPGFRKSPLILQNVARNLWNFEPTSCETSRGIFLRAKIDRRVAAKALQDVIKRLEGQVCSADALYTGTADDAIYVGTVEVFEILDEISRALFSTLSESVRETIEFQSVDEYCDAKLLYESLYPDHVSNEVESWLSFLRNLSGGTDRKQR